MALEITKPTRKRRSKLRELPAVVEPKSTLEAENDALKARVAELENILAALVNERSRAIQWLRWLRGHVEAGSKIFEQPISTAVEIHEPGNHNQGRTHPRLGNLW